MAVPVAALSDGNILSLSLLLTTNAVTQLVPQPRLIPSSARSLFALPLARSSLFFERTYRTRARVRTPGFARRATPVASIMRASH